MKKRILSLLLALSLLVGLLPTAVFAAEPEEALYAQMLDLGLVDAEGALIEDNTFTVAGGPQLNSLDELIQWLNQCEESDLNTRVTVDATGKSATVEQLMYALIIEYQMADVAGQLNTLASGTYAATRSAETGAVPTYVHNMRLAFQMARDGSILTVKVVLCDKKLDGTTYTAPYSIPVEVGMFADFLGVTDTDYAADSNSDVPGTNCFKRFVIGEGESSIEFKIDLQKLRTNYLSPYNGLWDGNTYLLFQARTVSEYSSMPDSTVAYCVSIAPSSDTDPVVNAITGGTVIGRNDDSSQTVVPYHLSMSNEGTATINSADYFKFFVDIPAAKDNYNASSFGWKNYFGRALRAGVGDENPDIKLENVTIWTDKKLSDNGIQFPGFYARIENDDSTPTDDEYILIANSPSTYEKDNFADGNIAANYLASMTKIHLGKWEDDTANVTGDTLYTKIKSHNWQLARFTGVKVPVYCPNENSVRFPQDWYLNVDWITQNDKNTLFPKEILMHGAMTIVDGTAPTIESVDVLSDSDVFYPGNIIPIVVTFSEPVYGDYQLVYLDDTGEATEVKSYLSSNDCVPTFNGDV